MANKRRLGLLGEHLVAKQLGGKLSDNPYDDVKDIVLESGVEVEVKTQVRWKNENAFTIDDTVTGRNLEKCLEVECLLFVEPGKNGVIRIYECTDRNYRVKTPRGIKTFLFDVDRMILQYTIIDHDLCEQMIEAASTNKRWLI